MLEDAILAAKAGDMGIERERDALSPQITVDAPIMIPEDYVPDLAVRMALYRRLNDCRDPSEIDGLAARSEEHTSELQSLMRISYAVFCLKKKRNKKHTPSTK